MGHSDQMSFKRVGGIFLRHKCPDVYMSERSKQGLQSKIAWERREWGGGYEVIFQPVQCDVSSKYDISPLWPLPTPA